jgi:hypothetical protein
VDIPVRFFGMFLSYMSSSRSLSGLEICFLLKGGTPVRSGDLSCLDRVVLWDVYVAGEPDIAMEGGKASRDFERL